MFQILGKELEGKVALKVHSGEKGNTNFLRPELFKDIYEYFEKKGEVSIVETNTAYKGSRNTTEAHKELLKEHKWTTTFPNVEILDEDSSLDKELDVKDPVKIPKNYTGGNIGKYKSMVVLTHFKGHGMGGFGGALKQLSIGCASSKGKANIHSAGKCQDPSEWKNFLPTQDEFLESMADAAGTIVNYFQGNMAFINVMKNISLLCDCAGKSFNPIMGDIGILSSLDPVAIDTACIDLIINSYDPGKNNLLEQINRLHAFYTIDVAAKKNIGNKTYQLINID